MRTGILLTCPPGCNGFDVSQAHGAIQLLIRPQGVHHISNESTNGERRFEDQDEIQSLIQGASRYGLWIAFSRSERIVGIRSLSMVSYQKSEGMA